MGIREGNNCILQVKDDGCGIPKEVVEALEREKADRESQVEPTSGKLHIMGLRIVKQIALAHKGDFQIKEEGHSAELILPIS